MENPPKWTQESTQEIKQDQVGEASVFISSGTFKGFKIIERTIITNVVFTGNYEEKGMPIFTVISSKTSMVMRPKVDIKKEMK